MMQSLGVKLGEKELKTALMEMDEDKSGMIAVKEFVRWWNKQSDADFHVNWTLAQELSNSKMKTT